MATNAPTEVSSDGPIDPNRNLPSDATHLGVDDEGDRHTYSRIENHVWVHDPDSGEVVLEQELGDSGLAGWIAHTDVTRGWASLEYADGFEDVLHDALETESESGVDR